jgi:ferredoxin
MLSTIIFIIIGIILVGGVGLWLYGERWRPLRLSTWNMMREAGLRRFLNLSGLHGYVYGRWTKEYLKVVSKILPHLGPRGKKWFSNHYHGKVLTQDQAEAIITLNKEIPLQDLEQISPYSTARNLVLKGPPDVATFNCACRDNRNNPCQPTQVCMAIGQPFVDFILEHHPMSSRRLTQTEALDLLRGEHERGHIHTAYFKDACMDRFYSLCNCCKCCCGGIEAMLKYGIPLIASSGYVAQVDRTHCKACGSCVDCCPFEASQVDGKATVKWEACMGCGVCIEKCPNEARLLARDERKGVPLEVRLLAKEQPVG